MEEKEIDFAMKDPHIIIGNPYIECEKCNSRIPKPIGVYIHAILTIFQTSHYVYVYYFEDKSTTIDSLYALLQFVGIEELHRRYYVEVPSKNSPDIKIKRFEVRWDKIASLKSLRWK